MNRAERIRALLCFGGLGLVLLLLVGRLAYLQVLGEGRLYWADGRSLALSPRAADAQGLREETLPAPRGTIVDRRGRELAVDLPVLDVHAELVLSRRDRESPERLRTLQQRLVRELVHVLAADDAARDDPDLRDGLRDVLRGRMHRAGLDPDGPLPAPRRIDFLVATRIGSVEVVEGLRALQRRIDQLYLHFLRDFHRYYPEREATHGVVGSIRHHLVPSEGRYRRHGVGGMESVVALNAGSSGRRLYRVDSQARPFWNGFLDPPDLPRVLHSTLDLDLQKAAVRELGRAAEVDIPEAFGSPPRWGALALVEVATGDVLAMASWYDGRSPASSAHAAYQQVFEPGSVVKALVFAVGLENGVLDWSREFDCTPTLPGNRWREPSYGREVGDVTRSGVLTPPAILQRSSNIGAVQVGMRLSRELFREYLDRFELGRATGLRLPAERSGTFPKDVLSSPERRFWKYTAPSLSIGYELSVTCAQLARAYLTLLSGRQRELRLYRGVELADRSIAVPHKDLRNPRFLSESTVARVRQALGTVVSSAPGATGRRLYGMLEEMGMGIDRNGRAVIGGKSGSSEGEVIRVAEDGSRSRASVRTATFVGFAPVDAPRYLAVAVFQKDDASKFYGGGYAAPPVGRLLLRALTLGSGTPRAAVSSVRSKRSGRAPEQTR